MDGQGLAVRFGYGLPAGAADVEALTAGLGGRDDAALTWPGVTLKDIAPVLVRYRKARQAKDEAAVKALQREADALALQGARAQLARAVGSAEPFRERLVTFWADHFTVTPSNRMERALPGILIDEAIRPHVFGRFAEMLRAVTTHPAMLIYLNQEASFGPGSRKGKRQRKGLNENLARELLELHTLGVGAGYVQSDVRELAELLTGLSVGPEGFLFDDGRAEPGAETVLGVTYDGGGMAPIRAVLDDLAARPETARHIASKLAVHFVADEPDPRLVEALQGVYRDTGGDLLALSRALVSHPSAQGPGVKVRQPYDFLVAALRALAVAPAAIMSAEPRSFRRLVLDPLEAMGQPLHRAPGPDGWPERAADWITPQGLAGRITWAMQAPARLVRPLPDPREFLATALGARAGEALVWAVAAAESARDGVGLVLASPEFNRR